MSIKSYINVNNILRESIVITYTFSKSIFNKLNDNFRSISANCEPVF